MRTPSGPRFYVRKGDVTRDDSQQRFLAQHSLATLVRHCFEYSSYNIVSTLQGHPRDCGFMSVKVMLQETIRNNDFEPKTALQHWCDIVSDSYNIVSTLQGCVALKIVVANRPV